MTAAEQALQATAPTPRPTPVETWLAGGPMRTLHGSVWQGRARVDLHDATMHRPVATGRGATLEEACADACNDLMRRQAEAARETDGAPKEAS